MQMEESSRPFQVNFSTLPTPKVTFSSRSSRISGDRLAVNLHRLQRHKQDPAGGVGGLVVQILTNARKRCQTMPIVVLREHSEHPGHRNNDLEGGDYND